MLKHMASDGVRMTCLQKSLSLAVSALMLSVSAAAADRSAFYTIVGPNGQIIVIDRHAAVTPSGEKASNNDQQANDQPVNEQQAKAQPSANVDQKAKKPAAVQKTAVEPAVAPSHPVTTPIPQAATPAPTAAPKATTVQPTPAKPVTGNQTANIGQLNSTTQSTYNPVTTVDGVQYVDSEYLEKKEFNLDDRKKFYSVPNGVGGTQVIERQKGLDTGLFRKVAVADRPKVFTLSAHYQRMSASDVESLTGTQCFSDKQLKRAKLVKHGATTDFWPRPSFEPKFDFVVAKFDQGIQDVELTSYASTKNNPKFYWPLPIFLDDKGCVIEAVHSFYVQTLPVSMSQYQALLGNLHVPTQARYMLLTPLEAAADLQHIQLSNQGQIRLTTIR